MNNKITQQELKQKLKYNKETGEFFWLVSSGSAKFGKLAGNLSDTGYIRIRVNSKMYKAHRLAWLYENGEFPEEQIDHINQIKTDNRIKNLRVVSNRENSLNHPLNKNNTSGTCGVYWSKTRKKWIASIMVHGKTYNLGGFTEKKEAIKIRKTAERNQGFHENHGIS